MPMKISVCIAANRLFPRLRETLNSYKDCNEVLLGYNGTEAMPAAFDFPDMANLRIVKQQWRGYGPTKNELASMAVNDWILSVDSDEVADTGLRHSLYNFAPAAANEIYLVEMEHYLGDKPVKHGAWGRGKTRFARLYNRTHTGWDEADVHETIVVKTGSSIKKLEGLIRHYTAETLAEFMAKNEYYAQLSASKYLDEKKRATLLKRFISPAFTFLKQYIFQLGFMDGAAGFHIAKGNAVYTFRKYQLLYRMQGMNANRPR